MQLPGWKILKNFIVTTMENEMYVYTEFQSLHEDIRWFKTNDHENEVARKIETLMTHAVRVSTNVYNI